MIKTAIITMLAIRKGILFISLIALFYSCGSNNCDPGLDVSTIDVTAKFERFDQDLFGLDTNKIEEEVTALKEKYPFFDFYTDILYIKDKDQTDEDFYNNLKTFVSNPERLKDYDTTQIVYGDISDIEIELTQALKYLRYYLPEADIPKLYTMFSEFSYGVVLPPDTTSCVIGLDMFFGQDFEAYYSPQIDLPKYITRTLNRDHIPTQVMYAILDDIIRVQSNPSSLLDYMVENGKLLYLLDQILPCTPDSVKWYYTKDQTKWVKDNQQQMWREIFVGKLYDTDYKSFQKYISKSPNSPNMPPEAPGNTGSYIGLQIVKAFMKRNPNISVTQLLKIEDSQRILKLSRYKP